MNDLRSSCLKMRITKVYEDTDKSIAFSGPLISKQSRAIRNVSIVVNTYSELVPIKINKGQVWTVSGVFETQKKTKKGYTYKNLNVKPTSLQLVLPTTVVTFQAFIKKDNDFKSIGPRKAKSVFIRFGIGIFTLLEQNNFHKILSESKLSQNAVERLIAGFNKFRFLKHRQWLSSLQVPFEINNKIVNFYKNSTDDVVRSERVNHFHTN